MCKEYPSSVLRFPPSTACLSVPCGITLCLHSHGSLCVASDPGACMQGPYSDHTSSPLETSVFDSVSKLVFLFYLSFFLKKKIKITSFFSLSLECRCLHDRDHLTSAEMHPESTIIKMLLICNKLCV